MSDPKQFETSGSLGCLVAFAVASGVVQFNILPWLGFTVPWWGYIVEAALFGLCGLLLFAVQQLDRPRWGPPPGKDQSEQETKPPTGPGPETGPRTAAPDGRASNEQR